MARVKNTMRLVNSIIGKIHPRYDLCSNNVQDIFEGSNDPYDLISNSFRFGYLQGMKAAKAEQCKEELTISPYARQIRELIKDIKNETFLRRNYIIVRDCLKAEQREGRA